MKTKNTMTKLAAGAALLLAAIAPSYGQNNLGAACGCPPVAGRPTVTLSTYSGFAAVSQGTFSGVELAQGAILTCTANYLLDTKIFIPAGQSIVIQPGTVIKAISTTSANASQAAALVIERGAKIFADGTKSCPVVFTSDLDPMNGSYGADNIGKWGGLIVLGKAANNIVNTVNTPPGLGANTRIGVCTGVGLVEGFGTDIPRARFGVLPLANASQSNVANGAEIPGTPDDNDNSGILRYISLRHTGAILTIGAEINGLTLGSVGRGTTIENIEIVSGADDGIEFFGGTVNVKYVSMLFGNDDMFDWDLGYRGKVQFLFGMKSDNAISTWSPDSDNGFESDGDDQKIYSNLTMTLNSRPVIYNATLIGNAKNAFTSGGDNSGLAAINAKELTDGEIYNSIFANWRNGLNLIKTVGTVRPGTSEAYHNWALAANGGNGNLGLRVKCNTFVNVTNTLSIANATTAVTAADALQFSTEGNVNAGTFLPGFAFSYTMNPSTNLVSNKADVIPNPAIATATTVANGCPTYPQDGFFTPVTYRGAFSAAGTGTDNWLSDWSYSALLGVQTNLAACATDINKDGLTNIADFLIFLPSFNSSCQ